jgi:hypothetical protein
MSIVLTLASLSNSNSDQPDTAAPGRGAEAFGVAECRADLGEPGQQPGAVAFEKTAAPASLTGA